MQYEADILSRVPWDEVDVSPLFDLPLGDETPRDVELLAGLDGGSRMVDVDPEASEAAGSRTPAPGEDQSPRESSGSGIDYNFAASHLLDAMPNLWRGHEAARRVFRALLGRSRPSSGADMRAVISTRGMMSHRLWPHMAERDRLTSIHEHPWWIAMLSVRLPEDIERRLAEVARKTGRTKTHYVREAILMHLEEIEDIHLAEERLSSPARRWTHSDLEAGVDMER